MLITSKLFNSSLLRINFGVVQVFKNQRKSVFDFTEYNENWIPRTKQYHKKRKPRQAAWDD